MNRVNRSSINMISSLLGYAVPMAIAMITTPMVLEGLGVSAYGLVSLINVLIGYLTVMDMGLDLPITKYLAEDKAKADNESANKLLNNAFQLYSIIGIVGMFLIVVNAEYLAYNVFKVPDDLLSDAVSVFQLAGIGFLASVLTSWGRAVSMGVQRFEITHGVSVITNLFGLSLGLFLIYLGYGVVGFVFMRVLFSLIAGGGYWYFVNRLLPFYRFKIGFDKNTLLRIRAYIGYGAINRFVSGLVSGLDKTLISAWIGLAANTIYSIPFMLVSSLGYMVSYMLGFLIPISSELNSVGELKKLNEIFTRSTKFITALVCMVFLPVLIFGDLFIKLWIDSEMSKETRDVLILLVIAGILSTLFASLSNNIIVGIGRIKEFTIYCTIRGLVLALGCFMLIEPLGIEGAGIALILTTIVDFIFLIIVLKKYLKISPMNLFLSAYLAPLTIGFILAVFILFFRTFAETWIGLIASIGLFEILYILMGFKFGVFGQTEKRVVLNFVNKLKS